MSTYAYENISSPNSKGINEEKLDKLVIEIYDYADKIKLLLNEVDDLVAETNNFYICDNGNDFRNKFNTLKTNFTIVNGNIISYAEDLVNAKISFQKIDSDMSIKTREEAKKVIDTSIGQYQEKR